MGLFDKIQPKIVAHKDEKSAVLVFYTSINPEKFNEEFAKISREGYELKATYVPPHSIAGFNVTLGSFFYFQKLGKSR